MKSTTYANIVSAIFIALFLYTGVEKLLSHKHFLKTVEHVPIISQISYAPLAFSLFLPIIEITITVLLLIRKTQKVGLILATLLMSLFSLYVAYMLITSSHLPCTCGGIVNWLTWKQHLIFNSALTITGSCALLSPSQSKHHALQTQ